MSPLVAYTLGFLSCVFVEVIALIVYVVVDSKKTKGGEQTPDA
jgi:hypothetical protein